MDSGWYVGLMSGTSMDSIDAALVGLSREDCHLIHAISYPLPADLRAELAALCAPGPGEIDRLGVVDRRLGRSFAEAVNQLLADSAVSPEAVRAIGSHGQTVRHRPNLGADNFSLQIGDPNTIAQATGITTVADFRRRDLAAGGQGAPLAPAFHAALFAGDQGRAVVNIGGIANVTLLSPDAPPLGFDTGPGNGLMDDWIQLHRQQPYDPDGQWADSGTPIPTLLETLLQDPYFTRPIPKSTGREEFHRQWLQHHLGETVYAAADVQATLLELTATSIARAIEALPAPVAEVYICGGGAYNGALMRRLSGHLHPRPVSTTAALGIAPEWVEAAAFAWLAHQTLAGLPGNLPSVTPVPTTALSWVASIRPRADNPAQHATRPAKVRLFGKERRKAVPRLNQLKRRTRRRSRRWFRRWDCRW